jgi:hypothetical protein
MLNVYPVQTAINFHKEKVESILNEIGKKEKSKNGVKHKLNKKVLDFIDNEKDDIIGGIPKTLFELQMKYDNLKLTENEEQSTKIIFEYVYERYFQKPFGKDFLNHLNIDTCVYCNRNYTLDFKNLNNSRAQLDHWFPKANFPILALSFYNLIPSCQSCNHIKGDGTKLIKKILKNENATNLEIQKWWKEDALKYLNHPYIDKNDFKFTWFFVNNFNDTNVEIREKCNKTKNTLEFNKTKEIYNTSSEKELKDLLDLRYKYSKNYLDILNKTFEGLNLSKEEAYRMIFGIETKEEDYHKRPFSKFKHDIIEELKNIK